MKWKIVVCLSIFINLVISPNTSNAHGPPLFPESLTENYIFKDKSMVKSDIKATTTKFVSYPAKCGAITCMIPGYLCGGIIGGTVSLVFSPIIIIKKRPELFLLNTLGGAAVIGSGTSFLGEIIFGTPFYIIQLFSYDLPKKWTLKNDFKKYEPLIDQIREMNLKSGQSIHFRIGDLSNLKSLRQVPKMELYNARNRAGLIWVEVDKNNKLKVTIETDDNGHGDRHGFAYSDEPFILLRYGNGWFRINAAGDLLFLTTNKMKRNNHWWVVVCDLR